MKSNESVNSSPDSFRPHAFNTAPPRENEKARLRDLFFYNLVVGAGKTRVLEAFVDLQVPEFFAANGPTSAKDVCAKLSLDPHRGWKFLHLAAMEGLLKESGGELGEDNAVFELSDNSIYFFGPDGKQGYFFRDVLVFHRAVHDLPIVDVLKGMPLPEAVRWPPPTPEAAEHLETWMRVSAGGAIETIVNSGAMAEAKSLLDVGGGDGTIGCALTDVYPSLDVTVFNLPASANIARRIIGQRGKAARVSVHEGDFLQDEFPKGFERVMYSRVLTDWTPSVCRMLLQKAERALAPGGRVVINEALVDGNEDYALAWEYRYLYYDTFGRAMYKTLETYGQLLQDAGLKITKVTPMIDNAFYSVIEAERI